MKCRPRFSLNRRIARNLSLIGMEDEKAAGLFSGAESANTYLRSFAGVHLNHRLAKRIPARTRRELATASGGSGFW